MKNNYAFENFYIEPVSKVKGSFIRGLAHLSYKGGGRDMKIVTEEFFITRLIAGYRKQALAVLYKLFDNLHIPVTHSGIGEKPLESSGFSLGKLILF